MSILVDKTTRVLCQGITGKLGKFETQQALAYGTCMVGGVSPGKGGHVVLDLPVFDTVREAVDATDAHASVIYVPAQQCKAAVIEAVESGIKLIVCITEGVPSHDMLNMHVAVQRNGATLLGPNSAGIITPDECKIGIMPEGIYRKGNVGIVSRSATLGYEAVKQTSDQGFGQSTCVGIGGDAVPGSRFVDVLGLFETDPDTQAILLVGEIGGSGEEEAAEYIKAHVTKPVAAYVAGMTAPVEKRMGHAGAIIAGGKGGAADKYRALESAGVITTRSPAELGLAIKRAALW